MTKNIKVILVPLDFSANSGKALDYAQMLGRRFGATLHLVHVCDVPSMMTASMDAHAITYSDWSQRLGDEAERDLVRIAAGVHGVKTSTEILFGNPARCIVTAATTNDADLIVMGTHGRGPVLHIVMGNVAERVVRTAPCPVLTVREPRAADWHKPRARSGAAAMVAMLLMAVLLSPAAVTRAAAPSPVDEAPSAPPAQAQAVSSGAYLFRNYCASCHGESGKGDGPLAVAMQRKPADLTGVLKRNNDVFPGDMVYRIIDGRQPVRGHGGPDMPEWGSVFLRSAASAGEASVTLRIHALVAYLETIQERAAR